MDPLIHLNELLFLLQISKKKNQQQRPDETILNEAKTIMKQNTLVGVASESGILDSTELENIKKERDAKITTLQAAIENAKEKFGQVEVTEAQIALALHIAKTGTKQQASEFFISDTFDSNALSTGKHIDLYFERIRIGLVWDDVASIKSHVAATHKLLDVGGDWDRRNRLKIYQGLTYILTRNFQAAAKELLSCIATFTAEELFSYERFCMYTVLTSLVALERVELKKQLVNSAEILAVMDAISMAGSSTTKPPTKDQRDVVVAGKLLNALYDCRYRDFFVHLIEISTILESDRYFARHSHWFIREMRARAYSQYLSSYRSVKLQSMATTFGVSVPFMESELARFIASKRVAAMVDNLAGVVETNRPDALNSQYEMIIKQGDALLNRVQKLARAINV
jgi:26S proteasome regulatory subunit N7